VDSRERHRHERIAERTHADGSGPELTLSAGQVETSRRGSQRDHALASLALPAGPEKEARRPHLETAQAAHLDLERTLAAAHLVARTPLDQPHLRGIYRFAAVRRLGAISFLLVACLASPAAARAADEPPSVRARAVIVANGATGEILLERNADRRVPIASLTKIMTALVTLEHARPAQRVRVRGRAPSIGESTIHLRVGERIRVRDLLAAALVQSANDAAFALAAHVGDGNVKAFVRLMNERADELGLDATRFVRPDGLDVDGHYSSARDVLTLSREAMKLPLFRRLVRLRGGTIAGGRSLYAWNDLLRTGSFPGIIGVKTGHTDAARWSQVAAAKRPGVTIYAVLLGSPTRARRNKDLAELLDWGFGHYARVTLIRSDRVYATAALPFSEERLPLVAARRVEGVVRLGRPLVERVVAPAAVDLPIAEGEKVGDIVVLDGRRVVGRTPLVAAHAADDASVDEKVGWYAGRAVDEAGDVLESVLGAFG
jgi:serine-type D-Ala-D-Ala carboxypeptidase (penicillin-binding protein 5/6)